MPDRLVLPVLAVLLYLSLPGAHAASFDCKLAHGKVEAMICADSGISKLDHQLDAAYARFHTDSDDGTAEQVLQRAWLRVRNACADMVCVRHAYESRIAELQARLASASPIAGFWKKEYGCSQATGVYQGLCKQGGRDSFWLAIAVNGERVCIVHMATAHLGNRVDQVDGAEPSMVGKVDGKRATVQFRSSWGATGTGLLRVDGNTLRRTVSTKDDGASWIPDQEVLTRIPAGPGDRIPACAG